MNNDIELQYEALRDTFEVIKQDIDLIENILLNVVKANNFLDESRWKAPEKTKMDSDYIPYMIKMSVNVPKAFRKHLNSLMEAVNLYEGTDNELKKIADNGLEDLKLEETK